MITKRHLTIPIFDYKVTVIIFDEWEELRPYLSPEAFQVISRGITIFGEGGCLVAINSHCGSTIAHESLHIVNAVWRYIGYEPQRDNDEVSAYLLTYIYQKITEIYYKHKPN